MRTLVRIVKFAIQSTFRNFWLSFVTTTVFVLTLLTINALVILNFLADGAIESLEDRVRVEVYFTSNASEDIIKSARGYLMSLSQVKTVDVVPAEEALAAFREEHKDSPLVLAALEEVDGNPIGDSLRISAQDADDFSFIVQALESPEFSPYIKDSNFSDSTAAIDRLASYTAKVRVLAIGLAVFFAFISTLIVFNTIRVAIYVHREEIGIMKLVGANDWFVRGPFVLETIMYALAATLVMAGATFGLLAAADPLIQSFFEGSVGSLVGYFTENGLVIFGVQFAGLALLGIVTTWFAIRKYLRV